MKTNSVVVILLLAVSLIFTSCLEQEAVYNSVLISANTFADEMGDDNGIASTEELNKMSDYFLNNSLAYFLSGSLNDYNPPLAKSIIANTFNISSDLYSSESEMREAYEGIGIKTPWVTIYMAILIDGEITITHIYRAPGPNVSEGNWERVEVK